MHITSILLQIFKTRQNMGYEILKYHEMTLVYNNSKYISFYTSARRTERRGHMKRSGDITHVMIQSIVTNVLSSSFKCKRNMK